MSLIWSRIDLDQQSITTMLTIGERLWHAITSVIAQEKRQIDKLNSSSSFEQTRYKLYLVS